jgi:quercetin dioxygenase-like cupin family protein
MRKASFTDNIRFGSKPVIDKIFETPFSKEIRICMSQGSVMKTHTAPGAISIMVFTGRVVIVSGNESLTLEQGDIVGFDANVSHSLQAQEESVVRLSLSLNDSVKRVISLV